MRFLVRRQDGGSRRSTCCGLVVTGAIRHPFPAGPSAATTVRAMTLMMMVKTNNSTPSPISADRNTPVASPNSFAMTAGML